jgi:BCD family chlorophyll transporter-like MFS transporter
MTPLGWLGIARLGLVQTALGSIVILTTSTLNRVMVVELALPAMLPGALVGWHYAVQLSRPRWGYGSDVHGSRVPWIIGGMGVLALGAVGAAVSTALLAQSTALGVACAFVAFLLIGCGVGASGTNLLALLATRTEPSRKAAAAAITWIMMISGFVATATIAGRFLDPFSLERLVVVTAAVSALAFTVTVLAVWRIGEPARPAVVPGSQRDLPFSTALAEIWEEPQARRFTIFVFVSMLAYSAQDLILEPFAGLIHGYTPGESTKLSGVQNGGVLLGMIATAAIGTAVGKSRARFMRRSTVVGCVASAVALAALAFGATVGKAWPLEPSVFALGLANGAFAVAAIGSMMTLAGVGRRDREGTRMGLWGAAQAVAFGLGGFLGAAMIDALRALSSDVGMAFATVFAAEAVAFVAAAVLAARVGRSDADERILPILPAGEHLSAE